MESLIALNKINKSTIDNAPSFLRIAALKECGKNKRNKILKNFTSHLFNTALFPLNVVRFIVRRRRFILNYFLEYLEYFKFLFSLKHKNSRIKTSKDKKNILFVIPFMVAGGATRVFLDIARETSREKYAFHLVTTSSREPNEWHGKFKQHFQNIVVPVKRVESEYICRKYLSQIIKKLNIDIVMVSNSTAGYNYLPEIKKESAHTKTIDLLHAEASRGARDEFEWAAPHLDRRVCVSNYLKEYMVEKYKKSGYGSKYINKLKVIHNGIDLTKYSQNTRIEGKFKSQHGVPDDTKIISFIGRFSDDKNPLLFVEVAKQVIEKTNDNYKLKFVMAGGGPEFDKVKNAIEEYRISEYFILTGTIDNVEELLADTYVLLLTSKKEGLPLVILESMAMKIPVISTDVGAIHELIKDNINGYLISPEDKVDENFTFKILDLLSGNQKYGDLVEKARETVVSEYSLETMGEGYRRIFDELIGEN